MKYPPLRVTALLILILLSLSCGKKTVPVPPQAIPPAPIRSLAYELDEKGVSLSWSLPIPASPSALAADIKEFLVEKAAYSLDGFCADCPLRYHVIARIPAHGPQVLRQQNYSYHEEGLQAGYIFFYRIKTGMGWRISGSSSTAISFTWQDPLGPPTGLKSVAADRLVSLSWQPPAVDLQNEPPSGEIRYQLYRNVGGNNFHPVGGLLAEPAYNDHQVINNIQYQYRVRASRLGGGSGVLSNTISATPQDSTPPPSPVGLMAINLATGIRLVWDPSPADDLAGYQVFRRSGADPEQKLSMIGQVSAPLTTYIDTPPENIQTWYYAVKALDRATPPNISPFSPEIKTERNR